MFFTKVSFPGSYPVRDQPDLGPNGSEDSFFFFPSCDLNDSHDERTGTTGRTGGLSVPTLVKWNNDYHQN